MAMDQKGIVRAVAERTGLSREESADITRAVLEGLAGQLSEGEARRLAADLPGPLWNRGRPRRAARSAERGAVRPCHRAAPRWVHRAGGSSRLIWHLSQAGLREVTDPGEGSTG